VFNRGEHNADWEEPLLKQIKHLREMTMRAEAARAGNRLKHAVEALSVVGLQGRTKRSVQTLGINDGCRVAVSTSSRQLRTHSRRFHIPAREQTDQRRGHKQRSIQGKEPGRMRERLSRAATTAPTHPPKTRARQPPPSPHQTEPSEHA
jgi:hypothetical protein